VHLPTPPTPSPRPATVVLFGAFDRHNLGDLLLPHIAAAMLPGRHLLHAGLAARDLRAVGGHRVQPLAVAAAQCAGRPAALVHVGGEVLGCSAWHAAAMLLPPAQAADTIAYLADRPAERQAWAHRQLGLPLQAPYVLSRALFPGFAPVVHAGVGGVGLAGADAALRTEVLAALRQADLVQVRDHHTLATLQAAGIAARTVPDPAVLVAALFGRRIARRARRGEPAAVRRAVPGGYLAVQCSAEFADDATLAQLADGLGRVAAARGLGLVLLQAGAAPWHDDPAVLQRLGARLRARRPAAAVRVFGGLDLWDLCALVAGSRGFCGSSLHGRIVAMAFARPRVSLQSPAPAGAVDKAAAFADTWDEPGQPAAVPPGQVAPALDQALAAAPAALRRRAALLVAAARQGFDELRAVLDGAAGR